MNWSNRTIEKMKRENAFRFQIAQLHFCHHRIIPQSTPPRGKMFEICIRLESEAEWCTDTINGEPQKVRFPNVAWKRPGGEIIIRSPQPRDTIAFQYSEEIMRDFFRIGMEPAVNCNTFILSPEIESLIQKLRKLIYKLYSPGIPDQIDWVCFQLYRELFSPIPRNWKSIRNLCGSKIFPSGFSCISMKRSTWMKSPIRTDFPIGTQFPETWKRKAK